MDLATTYLGLELRTPVIASAGPPTATADGVRALAAAGAGAVVLPSVFEEQLRFQADPGARMAAAGTGSFAEALGRLPLPRDSFESWPGKYLRLIGEAARTSGIPVIASLNGATPGGWSDYAAAMEDAGAAAIELNVYDLPGDPMRSARASEAGYAEMLPHVRAAVNIPVAVKLAPFSGSPGEAAFVLDQAGADGLVLFNRFLQTDIDAEALTVSAGFGLSAPGEAALPRAWISLLRGRVRCSLAASTGVETAADVAAYLLAGADVVMTTSALLRHGPGYLSDLLDGLRDWLERKGFSGAGEARGLLSAEAGHPVPGRAGYLSALDRAARSYG